jgi:hypothetical protein
MLFYGIWRNYNSTPAAPAQPPADPAQQVADPAQQVADPAQQVADPAQQVADPAQQVADPAAQPVIWDADVVIELAARVARALADLVTAADPQVAHANYITSASAYLVALVKAVMPIEQGVGFPG